MNAVIYLDVPDWQIGQDVSIYFPDTMVKHCKCELLKEQEAIVRCKDCKHYTLGVSGLDGYCEEWMRKTDGNEFFCADGEKRTD